MAKEKEELYRYKDYEGFKKAITHKPPPSMLKSRSIGGNKKSFYQPIEVIETLADINFREWTVAHEVYMNVLNEIVCTVKINALPDYPGADYMTFTGSASKQITCEKNSLPEKFPIGKKGNAIQYNLPAVRSDAIGCAFETLGNLFGRNVNREASNDFGYDVSYEEKEKKK